MYRMYFAAETLHVFEIICSSPSPGGWNRASGAVIDRQCFQADLAECGGQARFRGLPRAVGNLDGAGKEVANDFRYSFYRIKLRFDGFYFFLAFERAYIESGRFGFRVGFAGRFGARFEGRLPPDNGLPGGL